MIICHQCNHQNSNNSRRCEACLSVLPDKSSCPNCGQHHLDNARFCEHCGYLLASDHSFLDQGTNNPQWDIPDPEPPEPILELSPKVVPISHHQFPSQTQNDNAHSHPVKTAQLVKERPKAHDAKPALDASSPAKISHGSLVHNSTQRHFYLEEARSPIFIGKTNRQIMPDINLADFQHSEVVSRIHAKILISENIYYIQDNGSVNGTFINHQRLSSGEKRLLKSGDKISLGQGNLVAFTFELS